MDSTGLGKCMVKVIHGANDGMFAVEGASVRAVRSSLVDAFNIPDSAIAFVNGEQVDINFTLSANDTLEFCKQSGSKGMNRPFTEAEFRRNYAGYPAKVMDELIESVPHAGVNDDGQLFWCERSVDKWLDKRYSRETEDDGSDKMIPPSSIRIADIIINELTPSEWKLLQCVLTKSTVDKSSVSFDVAIEDVWGHDYDGKDGALKQHIKRINKKFSVQGSLATVHGVNRFVTISK